MLKFELNISKIKSSFENQSKVDENFIINYAKSINYFGSVVANDIDSYNLLKGICKVAECNLMINSPTVETVRLVLQKGVKKIIIPENKVEEISKSISKKIIIARITLRKTSLLNNNLTGLKTELKKIVTKVVPYCSELLIDYDPDFTIDESIVAEVLNYISDFNNYPLTFLDANNTFTELL